MCTPTILQRFALLIAVSALALASVQVVVARHFSSTAPPSVMGPDYNPPPPWIPVS